ncbi:hypothetical protein EDB89DRAFT_2008119 [Lactarius sanguifluus]|nr:hypothetical protein EDB89DRAFT_2008119 [Lactarius sanguifluus]
MSADNVSLYSASGADSTPIDEPHSGPGIGEIMKKSKRAEIGELSAGDQAHRKAMSIHMFPDSVLLEIFNLCRTTRGRNDYFRKQPAPMLEWRLVHVCQRWRNLIFASPSRLNLELLCTHGTPVMKGLDCWPAFPIVIKYDKIAQEDTDNIIAALEHPDRVRRITLSGVTKPFWGKIDAAMRQSFPILTHLWLAGQKDRGERALMLPLSLLGGGTLRLEEVYLQDISYPALPKLLLSANDLVHLHFTEIPPTCYISPEAMVTGLAGLTRLETLGIGFRSPVLLAEQRLTPPATPTVCLPALSSFMFTGFCEYLEDLVAQINAPRVDHFAIEYFSQPVYQVPQLSRFLSRSEYLKPPGLSTVQVRFIPWVNIWVVGSEEAQAGAGGQKVLNLTFLIRCSGMVRGVLHTVQILQHISASLSNSPPSDQPPVAGSLYGGPLLGGMFGGETLFGKPLLELPGVPDRINRLDWIEFLRPFTAVNQLVLRGELSENIIRALELARGEMTAHVLPALHTLTFIDQPSPSVEEFVSTRQNAGRPVTIVYPQDSDPEDSDHSDEFSE